MAACDDKVKRLERLVQMLKAENEELVRQGQLQNVTPIRSALKDCGNASLPRTPHTKLKYMPQKSSLSTPIHVQVRQHLLAPGTGNCDVKAPSTSLTQKYIATPKAIHRSHNPKQPPGTVLRLQSQCKELDGQLAELDAENNSLIEQVALLRTTLREKEANITDLEAQHTSMEDNAVLIRKANKDLTKKVDDLTYCLMATKRWDEFIRSNTGRPFMCTCPQKSERIAVLESRLRDISLQQSQAHADTEILTAQLTMMTQRHATEKKQRDRIEHEYHQLASQHRVLEMKCDGLEAQQVSSRRRLEELARQVPEQQHYIHDLKRHAAQFSEMRPLVQSNTSDA